VRRWRTAVTLSVVVADNFEQLQQARRASDVTRKRMNIVVNCPFV
jgi:transposase